MKKWFNIKINNDGSAEILIMGEIGWEVTAADFINKIHELENQGVTTFNAHINSPGGDVFEGLAIYNALKERNVNVYIDGLAASAASVIAMAGKKIHMAKNAFFMIHNPATMVFGDNNDMQKTAEQLAQIRAALLDIYLNRTTLSKDELIAAMDKTTFFDADRAKELGFVDTVEDEKQPTPNPSQEGSFQNFISKTFNNTYGREGVRPNHNTGGFKMNKVFSFLSRFFNKTITNEDEAMQYLGTLETQNKATDDKVTALESENDQLKAENTELKEQIEGFENLEEEALEAEINDLLDTAVDDGQITAAERPVWENQLKESYDVTKAALESRPKNSVTPGGASPANPDDNKLPQSPRARMEDIIRTEMAL